MTTLIWLDSFEQALSKHGLKISVFTDPDMALEDFKVNWKDCAMILSDIRMPGMNSYEFFKDPALICGQS